jgi:invasion protein IalB
VKFLTSVLVTAFFAVPVAVSAQAQPQSPTATTALAAADPNEVVCEKQEVTGSRLAHRKVCMTRGQWKDARSQDRAATEKVQTERGLIAPTPGG